MHWFVDGNNVMGAGGDGWWNDRVGAAVRLTQVVAEWTRTHDEAVTIVFDGRPEPRLAELAGGALRVDFARRVGRDGADDRIVELVEGHLIDSDVVEGHLVDSDVVEGDVVDGRLADPAGGPADPGADPSVDPDRSRAVPADPEVVVVTSDRGRAVPADPEVVVVTSDRGLVRRLPPEVGVEGAGTFRSRIGITPRRRSRPRSR